MDDRSGLTQLKSNRSSGTLEYIKLTTMHGLYHWSSLPSIGWGILTGLLHTKSKRRGEIREQMFHKRTDAFCTRRSAEAGVQEICAIKNVSVCKQPV